MAPPNATTAPTTPAPAIGVRIQSTVTSLCFYIVLQNAKNGAVPDMGFCDGGGAETWRFDNHQWKYDPDPSKCVKLIGANSTNGNKLGVWDCDAEDSQQLWGFDVQCGRIYLASDASKCVQNGGEHDEDPLVIWDCNMTEPSQVFNIEEVYGPSSRHIAV